MSKNIEGNRGSKNMKKWMVFICCLCMLGLVGCGSNEQTVKLPTSEKLLEAQLSSYDFELLSERNLSTKKNELTEEYISLQALYRKAFSWYIEDILTLSTYEQQIKESDYVLSGNENNHVYDYIDSDYFYLISTCYIERLSNEDIELLKDIWEKYGLSIDRESEDASKLLELVKETYDYVVCESYGDEEPYIFYLNDWTQYQTHSKAIILGVGVVVRDHDSNWEARLDYLAKLKEEIENDAKETELKSDITVFVFDKQVDAETM